MHRSNKSNKNKYGIFSKIYRSVTGKHQKNTPDNFHKDIHLRLVVVGDFLDGKKTRLLDRYITQITKKEFTPTYVDDTTINLDLLGYRITLGLVDTSGFENHDSLRATDYKSGDITLLAFDSTDTSFNNLAKWINVVKSRSNDCMFVLVRLTDNEEKDFQKSDLKKKISNFCKEHNLKLPLTCNLDDIHSINRTFNCSIIDKLETMAETKEYLANNAAAVNSILNPEKAFFTMVSLIVAAWKRNPDSQFSRVPMDILKLLIKQAAEESNLPYNKKVVDDFLNLPLHPPSVESHIKNKK